MKQNVFILSYCETITAYALCKLYDAVTHQTQRTTIYSSFTSDIQLSILFWMKTPAGVHWTAVGG